MTYRIFVQITWEIIIVRSEEWLNEENLWNNKVQLMAFCLSHRPKPSTPSVPMSIYLCINIKLSSIFRGGGSTNYWTCLQYFHSTNNSYFHQHGKKSPFQIFHWDHLKSIPWVFPANGKSSVRQLLLMLKNSGCLPLQRTCGTTST